MSQAIDILRVALEALPGKWEQSRAKLDALYALRNGTPKDREEARKRLEHPGFRTTNVMASISGLSHTRHQILSKLDKLLPETVALLAEEMITAELLKDLVATREANYRRTQERRRSGLYEGARGVFDALYNRHQISADMLRNLTDSDVDRVAHLIKEILINRG